MIKNGKYLNYLIFLSYAQYNNLVLSYYLLLTYNSGISLLFNYIKLFFVHIVYFWQLRYNI